MNEPDDLNCDMSLSSLLSEIDGPMSALEGDNQGSVYSEAVNRHSKPSEEVLEKANQLIEKLTSFEQIAEQYEFAYICQRLNSDARKIIEKKKKQFRNPNKIPNIENISCLGSIRGDVPPAYFEHNFSLVPTQKNTVIPPSSNSHIQRQGDQNVSQDLYNGRKKTEIGFLPLMSKIVEEREHDSTHLSHPRGIRNLSNTQELLNGTRERRKGFLSQMCETSKQNFSGNESCVKIGPPPNVMTHSVNFNSTHSSESCEHNVESSDEELALIRQPQKLKENEWVKHTQTNNGEKKSKKQSSNENCSDSETSEEEVTVIRPIPKTAQRKSYNESKKAKKDTKKNYSDSESDLESDSESDLESGSSEEELPKKGQKAKEKRSAVKTAQRNSNSGNKGIKKNAKKIDSDQSSEEEPPVKKQLRKSKETKSTPETRKKTPLSATKENKENLNRNYNKKMIRENKQGSKDKNDKLLSAEDIHCDFVIRNWTLYKTSNFLCIAGDKFDKHDHRLLESNFITKQVLLKTKNKPRIVTTDGTYFLKGKLCDPENLLPESVKKYCCKEEFPLHWRTALNCWLQEPKSVFLSRRFEESPFSRNPNPNLLPRKTPVVKSQKLQISFSSANKSQHHVENKKRKNNKNNLDDEEPSKTITSSQEKNKPKIKAAEEKSKQQNNKKKNETLAQQMNAKNGTKSLLHPNEKKKDLKRTNEQKANSKKNDSLSLQKQKSVKRKQMSEVNLKQQKIKKKKEKSNDSTSEDSSKEEKENGPGLSKLLGGDSILCRSGMSPSALISSIKKNAHASGRHTPPMRIINEIMYSNNTQQTNNIELDSSVQNVEKVNPVVQRITKKLKGGPKASRKKGVKEKVDKSKNSKDAMFDSLMEALNDNTARTPTLIKKIFKKHSSDDESDFSDISEIKVT